MFPPRDSQQIDIVAFARSLELLTIKNSVDPCLIATVGKFEKSSPYALAATSFLYRDVTNVGEHTERATLRQPHVTDTAGTVACDVYFALLESFIKELPNVLFVSKIRFDLDRRHRGPSMQSSQVAQAP